MLATIGGEWVRTPARRSPAAQCIRSGKCLQTASWLGDSLLTARRTVTEADIVNFACLSGDHFYAHG